MIKLIFRIILDIVIATVLIHGWWYFAILLCIIGIWNFPFFIEVLFAGFIYDSLFGLSTDPSILAVLGLIIAIVLFAVVSIFKKIVRIKE